jgi:hypothetical protein
VRPSSSTLRKAADLQEQIERLQKELADLLQTEIEPAVSSGTPAPSAGQGQRQKAPAEAPSRARKPASTAKASSQGRGGKRRGSPSGPLAPAVVNVLKAGSAPMSVSEILEGLIKSGYQYPSSEPKKNLSARIYRLKGVRQVGPGRFAAE